MTTPDADATLRVDTDARLARRYQPDAQFAPGTLVVERYRIASILGKGGMGEVYRADDIKLGQTVALKFLPARLAFDAKLLDRLHDEVRLGRQVAHPNVCRIYDIGQWGDAHFVAMEYVDGEDLARLLYRIGRLPHDKAVDVMRGIAAGLGAAHAKGILHRDLKPANVMIDSHGDARITDFGLALTADDDQEDMAGTPALHGAGTARRRVRDDPERSLRARFDHVRDRHRETALYRCKPAGPASREILRHHHAVERHPRSRSGRRARDPALPRARSVAALVVLSMVLRKRALTVGAFLAIVMAVHLVAAAGLWIYVPFVIALAVLEVYVLVRHGLLSFSVMAFVFFVTTLRTPAVISPWAVWLVAFPFLVVIAAALWAFRVSLGGQSAWHPALLMIDCSRRRY